MSGNWLLLAYTAMPPLFTLISMVIGIGEMNYWFNSRFVVLASPVLILLAAGLMQELRRGARGRAVVAVGLVGYLALQSFMIMIDKVPVYLDARGGFGWYVNPYSVQTGEALRSAYDGGKIMIMTGSAQEHRIVLTAGIPLGQFDEILESSTSKKSYDQPWLYDRWLVIGRAPDSDAVSAVEQWNARRDLLNQYYRTTYENQYYEILVRNDPPSR